MEAFIAAGSNLKPRLDYLQRGLKGLQDAGIAPVRLSSVWETDAVDCVEPLPFLNMVLKVETALPPEEMLGRMLAIERSVGRHRSVRNAPRELDLDLLLAGGAEIDTPKLTLPHRRMWRRRFVLAPLAEIAPELRNPESGRTVAEEERRLCGEQPGVRRHGRLAWPSVQLL